jgi:hypothetical protein
MSQSPTKEKKAFAVEVTDKKKKIVTLFDSSQSEQTCQYVVTGTF